MARARTTPAAPAPATLAEVEPEAEEVPIHLALSRVMGDVQSVSKSQRNTSQNYSFRGIDAVVNAVGPALRKHGVVVVPIETEIEEERFVTKSGAHMRGVTLTVTFRFYGPMGDHLDAQAVGESADSGDKATPKAHSVAFRTMLLQALCIPTDEPDPDSSSYERGAHESGFQGGRQTDRAARPSQQQQGDGWIPPKDWKELARRFAERVGAEEAIEWMAQASEVAIGSKTPVRDLPEDDQRAVWDVLTKSLHDLDLTEGDLQLHPQPRETIAAVFAKHLDGVILNGPRWALTGDEAERDYPAKDDVVVAGDPTPEISNEDAAAAEAEHDREQAADVGAFGYE